MQIDEETGEIEVLHAWDVHDAGQIINPALMKGQVHGAFGMGISETIWEEVVFNNNGKIMNADVGGYRIITAMDMPNFTNDLIKSNDEPATPWGLKEIGEGSNNPTMGAVRNAIYDAIGVNISTLPLSFEKVWRAIKEKKEQEQISE